MAHFYRLISFSSLISTVSLAEMNHGLYFSVQTPSFPVLLCRPCKRQRTEAHETRLKRCSITTLGWQSSTKLRIKIQSRMQKNVINEWKCMLWVISASIAALCRGIQIATVISHTPRKWNNIRFFWEPNDTQLAQSEDCAHGVVSCKHPGREETTYQSKERTPFKAVAAPRWLVSISQLNRGFLFHFP